jgi:hypothetical protein
MSSIIFIFLLLKEYSFNTIVRGQLIVMIPKLIDNSDEHCTAHKKDG